MIYSLFKPVVYGRLYGASWKRLNQIYPVRARLCRVLNYGEWCVQNLQAKGRKAVQRKISRAARIARQNTEHLNQHHSTQARSD